MDSEQLDALSQVLYDRIAGWETRTLERIGKRIKETGHLTKAQAQAIKNIVSVQGDVNSIMKDLARVTETNIKDVKKIYTAFLNGESSKYKELYDFRGIPLVPFSENTYAKTLVANWAKMTANEMLNLSRTIAIGFTNGGGNFMPLAGTFQTAIDKAVFVVSTGTQDFNSAMRQTITEIGGSGVRTNYASGVSRRLDSMIRQNILWGAKQASIAYNNEAAEELGCDIFYVDYHSNPRPSHEFMGGKQFSLGDAFTDSRGEYYPDGRLALERLQDYGCLHFATRGIAGVSESPYSQADIRRLRAEDSRSVEIDGITKSKYEWKQTQRKLEVAVRQQKGIVITAKASGDRALAEQAQAKIKSLQNKYTHITSKAGLQPTPERMTVSRFTTYGRKRT